MIDFSTRRTKEDLFVENSILTLDNGALHLLRNYRTLRILLNWNSNNRN